MCLICIEFDKAAMTSSEARRALGEMRVALDPIHLAEVEAKLAEAEAEEHGPHSPASRPTPIP
jgi:hypothetical protein